MTTHKHIPSAGIAIRVRAHASLVVAFALVVQFIPTNAYAVSTWNPTLLVNTESFQQIDRGDGSTTVDLQFGATTSTLKLLTSGVFQFNKSLSVLGGISGSYLTIDGQSNFSGALVGKSTITAKGTLSGRNLVISGLSTMSGALSVKGNLGVGTSIPETKMEIIGTLSGTKLHGQSEVSTSGSLIIARGKPKLLGTSAMSAATDVEIAGRYAYVANGTDLKIVDITVSGSPAVISTLPFASATVNAVTISGKFAYVSLGASGLGIVDVSNPSAPRQVGSYDLTGNAIDVAVSGQYAYVSDDEVNVNIIDVSKPSAPRLVGTYNRGASGPQPGITVVGTYLYVSDYNTIAILDISNPASPRVISTSAVEFSIPVIAYAVQGRYLYYATESAFKIYDISNPGALVALGTYSGLSGATHRISVAGKYAYIADDFLGILVLDISSPSNIQFVASYVSTSANAVVPAGGKLYVADGGGGLRVFGFAGIDAPGATIGAIDTDVLSVKGEARVSGNAKLDGGLSVGQNLYVFGESALRSISGVTLTLSSSGRTAVPVLNAVGIISGAALHISGPSNISGSLMVKQSITTKSSFSGASFFGSGLGDCNNSTTSKIIYNPSTGKFTCATDQTGGGTSGGLGFGDARGIFVRKSGDTMTGALTIQTLLTHTTTGALNVVQQTNATGAYIKSTTNKEPALAIDIVGTPNAPHLLFGYQGVFDTNLYRASANLLKTSGSFFAVGTISGSKLRVDGNADIHGALAASGAIRTDGDLTINDDRTTSADAVLTFGNSTTNQTLKYIHSLQKFQFSKDLSVIGNISGSTLRVDGNASVNGTLSLSGATLSRTISDPSAPGTSRLATFASDLAGRALLKGKAAVGGAYAYQPGLFQNFVMMLTPGGGTTVTGMGTTVTNDTTVSHPTADEVFGFMTNFATSTTNNDTAGTSSANTTFIRGSTTGANGFFYRARIGVVDTTSIRVFSGIANQTIATMVGADNPTGHHVGFQFSTNRSDTNWMFTTRDGATQTAASTGIAFTANKVYDLTFFCSQQCTSIIWRIDNVTDGTNATGTASANLPGTTTALRIVQAVSTLTTAAKNLRMQFAYTESDR